MKNLVMYVKSNKKAKIITTIILFLCIIAEYFGLIMVGLYAFLSLLYHKFSISIIGVIVLLCLLILTVLAVFELYGKLNGGKEKC